MTQTFEFATIHIMLSHSRAGPAGAGPKKQFHISMEYVNTWRGVVHVRRSMLMALVLSVVLNSLSAVLPVVRGDDSWIDLHIDLRPETLALLSGDALNSLIAEPAFERYMSSFVLPLFEEVQDSLLADLEEDEPRVALAVQSLFRSELHARFKMLVPHGGEYPLPVLQIVLSGSQVEVAGSLIALWCDNIAKSAPVSHQAGWEMRAFVLNSEIRIVVATAPDVVSVSVAPTLFPPPLFTRNPEWTLPEERGRVLGMRMNISQIVATALEHIEIEGDAARQFSNNIRMLGVDQWDEFSIAISIMEGGFFEKGGLVVRGRPGPILEILAPGMMQGAMRRRSIAPHEMSTARLNIEPTELLLRIRRLLQSLPKQEFSADFEKNLQMLSAELGIHLERELLASLGAPISFGMQVVPQRHGYAMLFWAPVKNRESFIQAMDTIWSLVEPEMRDSGEYRPARSQMGARASWGGTHVGENIDAPREIWWGVDEEEAFFTLLFVLPDAFSPLLSQEQIGRTPHLASTDAVLQWHQDLGALWRMVHIQMGTEGVIPLPDMADINVLASHLGSIRGWMQIGHYGAYWEQSVTLAATEREQSRPIRQPPVYVSRSATPPAAAESGTPRPRDSQSRSSHIMLFWIVGIGLIVTIISGMVVGIVLALSIGRK